MIIHLLLINKTAQTEIAHLLQQREVIKLKEAKCDKLFLSCTSFLWCVCVVMCVVMFGDETVFIKH